MVMLLMFKIFPAIRITVKVRKIKSDLLWRNSLLELAVNKMFPCFQTHVARHFSYLTIVLPQQGIFSIWVTNYYSETAVFFKSLFIHRCPVDVPRFLGLLVLRKQIKVTPTTFWLKCKNLPKCTKFCYTRKLEVAAKNFDLLTKRSSHALANTGA